MRRAIVKFATRLNTLPIYRFSTFKPNFNTYSSKPSALWRPIRYSFSTGNQESITMPALSPTMNTGKIVKWTKKVGDKVNAGDLLCQVETDKATVDFETNSEGYLAKIVKQEGESADVGEEVAIIVENEADIKGAGASEGKKEAKKTKQAPKAAKKQQKEQKKPKQQAKQQQAQEQQQQNTQKTSKSSKPQKTEKTQKSEKSQKSQKPAKQQSKSKSSASTQRVVASPLAKSVAQQKNVDLHGAKGSGPGGRIIEQDVQELASQAASKASKQAAESKKTSSQQQPAKKQSKFVAPENPSVQIPLTGMRKTIAARLLESKTTIPHYYISVDVQMDNIEKLRSTINSKEAQNGIKITVNDFILKAAGLALRDYPAVNVQWGENSIKQFKYSDVSMAVSTESGLITPIIFRSQTKGLIQIAKEAKQLAKKARENKLQPSEFVGGTISVSNAGMFGLNQMVSVINPPQAIILGVAKAEKKILFDQKATDPEKPYKVASVMTVWASVDHRLVDGALAAQYLGKVKKYLQDPINMIL